MPDEPHQIVRPEDVRKKYIPLGKTAIADLIKSGHLEVVRLTPSGRAKGITLRSIRAYQREVMGLNQDSQNGKQGRD
jgi:hypothetical protein